MLPRAQRLCLPAISRQWYRVVCELLWSYSVFVHQSKSKISNPQTAINNLFSSHSILTLNTVFLHTQYSHSKLFSPNPFFPISDRDRLSRRRGAGLSVKPSLRKRGRMPYPGLIGKRGM